MVIEQRSVELILLKQVAGYLAPPLWGTASSPTDRPGRPVPAEELAR